MRAALAGLACVLLGCGGKGVSSPTTNTPTAPLVSLISAPQDGYVFTVGIANTATTLIAFDCTTNRSVTAGAAGAFADRADGTMCYFGGDPSTSGPVGIGTHRVVVTLMVPIGGCQLPLVTTQLRLVCGGDGAILVSQAYPRTYTWR